MEKKLKDKKCKSCGETFTPFRPLQPVCSSKCEGDYKREQEAAKAGNSKTKPKAKKGIAPISEKRLGQMAEYRKKRKAFLAKPENHYCPVMKHNTGAHVRVTEIHHKNSRNGDRLNDEDYWLAVSRPGHQWIHSFPKKARLLGWLI